MSAENLLAIDVGTQSVRALLFNPRGELLAKNRIPIEPYFSTAPGLAEQHLSVFWEALCKACRGLWQRSGVPVCAGFGVRTARQVDEIGRLVPGVVVGSALVETLERGEDPTAFLAGLRSSEERNG